MDLDRIIDELLQERNRVQQSIEALEKSLRTRAVKASPARSRKRRVENRGRKFMGDEERQQVALRMKTYWERKRRASHESPDHPEPFRMPPSSQHSHAAAAAL